MTTERVTAGISLVNSLATLGFVGVTVWYTHSTARMLREMQRQREVARSQ